MNILIVDDHVATVSFMRLAFSGAGHTVMTAATVRAARQRVSEAPVDVVLTDLTFGDDDGGLELARWLRADPSTGGIGILAVSGDDTPEVLQATVECGFDGFVPKPVDLASLLARVEQLADVVATRRTGEHHVDHA